MVGSSLLLFSLSVFFLLVFVSKINIMVLFYNKDSCRNKYLLSGHQSQILWLAGRSAPPAPPSLVYLLFFLSLFRL